MKIKIEIRGNGKKIKREFEGDEQIFEAFVEEIEKQIRISSRMRSEMDEEGKKQYAEGWK